MNDDTMAADPSTITADDDTTDTSNIEKWSFVVLRGLQSAAGQKLNGALAVVLNAPTTDDGGTQRYPVRIFALREEQEEGPVQMVATKMMDKKIKAENLAVKPMIADMQIFKLCAINHICELQSQDPPGKKILWWLECYHRARPTEHNMTMTFASALRFANRSKEASDMLWNYHDELLTFDLTHCGEDIRPRFLFDHAMCYACSGEHLQEALELALAIPLDTEGNKSMAREVLYEIGQSYDKTRDQNMASEEKDLEMAQLKLTCFKKLLEWESPNFSGDIIADVGASYCLTGDNLEGARYYRAALAVQGTPVSDRAQRKTNLVLAQMQCPGGKLEDYYVLGIDYSSTGDGLIVSAIPRNARQSCRMVLRDQASNLGLLQNTGGGEVKFTQVSAPIDPDDESEFSLQLLEQVRLEPTFLQELKARQ